MVGVVPALPRLAVLAVLVLAGGAWACGGAATSAPQRSALKTEVRSAPALETRGEIAGARPGAPVRPDKDQLDRVVSELSLAAEKTGFTDLGVLVDLSTRQIERAALV